MDRGIAILLAIVAVFAMLFVFSGGKAGVQIGGQKSELNLSAANISAPNLPNLSGVSLPSVGNITVPEISIGENFPENLPEPVGSNMKTNANFSATDVKFSALDGVEVHGTLYQPLVGKSNGAVVLLHSLGKDRHQYDGFAQGLASRNFTALSIDMRGHGQTRYKNGFASFTTSDWLSAKKDIDAAFSALLEREGAKLVLIGSSIGGNLAAQYSSEKTPKVDALVLLSPGMEYHGVAIEDAASKLAVPKMLAMAGEGDSYSAMSVRELGGLNGKIQVKVVGGGAHGAEMLKEGASAQFLYGWLES